MFMAVLLVTPGLVNAGYCGWPVGPGPCNWLEWGSWSSCSSLCGGGIRTRRRSACCWPHASSSLSKCLDNCNMPYSGHFSLSSCNNICCHGHMSNGRCNCALGYYGYYCQFRKIIFTEFWIKYHINSSGTKCSFLFLILGDRMSKYIKGKWKCALMPFVKVCFSKVFKLTSNTSQSMAGGVTRSKLSAHYESELDHW